jgi:hypothetical protein
MKIHIFYRHYNISGTDGKQRPEWFDYEKCLQNLLHTTNKNVFINIIYDGKLTDKNFINNYKNKVNKIFEITGGSDFKSFQNTCEIIKNDSNIKDKDIIYFLENDYLHVENWTDKIIELFQTYEMSYVSLYDHNDKYFLPMYDDLVSKIFTTLNHHWRTTPSTCNSFVLPKKIFDEDYDILSTMEGDHNKFIWLTENRNRFVVTPIPGLSTHCMSNLLSPTIEWKKLINDISNNTNI